MTGLAELQICTPCF